jgi:hypothetical protein
MLAHDCLHMNPLFPASAYEDAPTRSCTSVIEAVSTAMSTLYTRSTGLFPAGI